jgi:Prp8 binding protein
MAFWDAEYGQRIKKFTGLKYIHLFHGALFLELGHNSFVNSCFPSRRGPQLVVTGSDDNTAKVKSP